MPRPPTNNVRINMFIEPNVLRAAKALASRRGSTYSAVIRDATRIYVTQELKREQAALDPQTTAEQS